MVDGITPFFLASLGAFTGFKPQIIPDKLSYFEYIYLFQSIVEVLGWFSCFRVCVLQVARGCRPNSTHPNLPQP